MRRFPGADGRKPRIQRTVSSRLKTLAGGRSLPVEGRYPALFL